MTWKPENCDFCGDCLIACQYVDYSQEKAIDEMTRLIKGEATVDILNDCITCAACNEYCYKGARPFDLIVSRMEETGVWKLSPEGRDQFDGLVAKEPGWKIEGEKDKPWMSLCAMKNVTPNLFQGRLFDGLTLFGGTPYYCWLGYIHGGLESPPRLHLKETIDNLNALPTDEIIFYHDECMSTLWEKAPEYGLSYSFRPIHIFEYLVDYVKKNYKDVQKLGLKIAYQQSDSQRYGPSRDPWLDELFELIGVRRVPRQHDRRNALCCSLPFMVRNYPGDQEKAAAVRKRNIDDAISHEATHIVFGCPYCLWALGKDVTTAGLTPLMIEDLVKMAFGETPSG